MTSDLDAPAEGRRLRVTILGSGTSSGVPVIACRCAVCTSESPFNRRTRTSVRIEVGDRVVLIDTSTDLRQQALRHAIDRVDAVIYTHAHADHILGLDDLRIFNFRQGVAIPCYGSSDTLHTIARTFSYVFEGAQSEGGGRPQIDLIEIGDSDRSIHVCGLDVIPIPVMHGRRRILGYRVGTFAYVTDCSMIPDDSFGLLEGVEFLVLGALRYRPHPTHFTVEEAQAAATRIGARQTYLTHIAHDVDHENPLVSLREGVEIGFDGLTFELA